MTETEKSVPAIPGEIRRPHRVVWAGVILVTLLALAAGAAWLACPWVLRMRSAGPGPDAVQLQQRLSAAERQIETLSGRLNELDVRTANAATANETAIPSASMLTHMQSDLVTLSSAVGTLQAQLKQAAGIAAHVQQTAQSSLAAAIAFIQLRAAAEAGRGFATELAALHAAVRNDAVFQEAAQKLDPYAASGVSTMESLRAAFFDQESAALAAIDKSAAQNWRQRLWAEIKSLVSIRPLHGSVAADAFTVIEDALASGDLGAALTAEARLPAAAQDALKDWRLKAEARATVESALHELSDHFIALSASPVPNGQDEP